MKESLLDILRCPECKGELELTIEKEDEEIEEGTLHCKECSIDYPIEDGIPNMIPPES
ncbi:MAG: methytransferase partner Trm112 [Candidatus Saliniplasma sp.]